MRGIKATRAVVALAVIALIAGVGLGSIRPAQAHRRGPTADYVVLYRDPHSARAAHAAIAAADGKIVDENRDIGSALVRSTDLDFLTAVREDGSVMAAAHDRAIGHVPSHPRARNERGGRASNTNARHARPSSTCPTSNGPRC